jgi:hypothetical protein
MPSLNKTKKKLPLLENTNNKDTEIRDYIISYLDKHKLTYADSAYKFIILFLQLKIIVAIVETNVNIDFNTILKCCNGNINNKTVFIGKLFNRIIINYNGLLMPDGYEAVDAIRSFMIELNIILNNKKLIVETIKPVFDKYSKKDVMRVLKTIPIFYSIQDYDLLPSKYIFYDIYYYKKLSIFYTENKKQISTFFTTRKPNIKGGGIITDTYHYIKEKTIGLSVDDKNKIIKDITDFICVDELKSIYYKIFLISYISYIETFIFENINKINNVIIIDDRIDDYLNSITDRKYKKKVIDYLRFLVINKQQFFIVSKNESNLEKLYNYFRHDYFPILLGFINNFYDHYFAK